jgi:hypothetical protein
MEERPKKVHGYWNGSVHDQKSVRLDEWVEKEEKE